MKKIFAVLVSGMMLFALAACGSKDNNDAGAADKYKAGTYTASAQGMNGDVTVEVVLSGSAIDSVKVTEHAETAGISDPAIADVPAAIVAAQSADVDAVTGATITSDAIMAAVKDCLSQAAA